MEYKFSINLTYAEFLPYYQGKFQNVQVVTFNGMKVQFPAMHLRQFMTRTGVKGIFSLKTENNKFSSLKKLS